MLHKQETGKDIFQRGKYVLQIAREQNSLVQCVVRLPGLEDHGKRLQLQRRQAPFVLKGPEEGTPKTDQPLPFLS